MRLAQLPTRTSFRTFVPRCSAAGIALVSLSARPSRSPIRRARVFSAAIARRRGGLSARECGQKCAHRSRRCVSARRSRQPAAEAPWSLSQAYCSAGDGDARGNFERSHANSQASAALRWRTKAQVSVASMAARRRPHAARGRTQSSAPKRRRPDPAAGKVRGRVIWPAWKLEIGRSSPPPQGSLTRG